MFFLIKIPPPHVDGYSYKQYDEIINGYDKMVDIENRVWIIICGGYNKVGGRYLLKLNSDYQNVIHHIIKWYNKVGVDI